MNKRFFLIIPVIIVIFVVFVIELQQPKYDYKYNDDTMIFDAYGNEGDQFTVGADGKKTWTSFIIELKPDLVDTYKELSNTKKAVVVYPLFTASAYTSPGFYDYYHKQCDESCLTSTIETSMIGQASGNGFQVLKLLGYEIITDIDIHNNPDILKEYDKVILLHNEYVTQKEFDAISEHPNVIYLYPNALYGKIEYDGTTITMIRGHNYPEDSIKNGFDWKFDNTPMEYDSECKEMQFYQVDNGFMLNCYPEIQITKDARLLKIINEL